MKDLEYRSFGEEVKETYLPNGDLFSIERFPSSSVFIIRKQISTSGPRPPPGHFPPVHPYYFNYQVIEAVHRFGNYTYENGAKVKYYGPYLSPIISGAQFPDYDWDSLYNQALEKLNEKNRGSLDLGVDLIEAKKTAKMLSLTKQVTDYTKTFMGRFPLLKIPGNAWLAYKYGVKPLVKSIFDIADENLREVMNATSRRRGRANDYVRPNAISLNTVFGYAPYPITGGSIKYSVTIGTDIRTEQHDHARWSTLNPFGLAWETLPFSFVADWFYNVGGYLRNYETFMLYANKFRSGYVTSLAAGEVTGEVYRNVKNVWPHVEDLHTCRVKLLTINRTQLTQYPSPALPSLKVDLGSSRLLSAASLLTTLLKGR